MENSVVQIPTHSRHKHTHTLTRMHIRAFVGSAPGGAHRSQTFQLPAGGPGLEPLPFSFCVRARPNPSGSRGGAGPPARAPPRGRSGGRAGGRRGWGRGGRAGAGVSLPPSLSPVKSRGAAGLSPVSSSCSLGRAAVTVHRRRRGLHRRVRPPAWPPPPPAPASPTTTSFSRSLASTVARLPPRPPPCPQRPGAMRLLAPPPGPAPVAAAPPWPAPPPAFPARFLRAPSSPAPCPAAAPSSPCSGCLGCCTPRYRGDCSPRTAPGRLQPRPSRTLQAPLILTLAAGGPFPTLLRSSLSTPFHVPRA